MAEIRKTVNIPAELYDAAQALLPGIRKIKGHRVTMASFVEEAMNRNLDSYSEALRQHVRATNKRRSAPRD